MCNTIGGAWNKKNQLRVSINCSLIFKIWSFLCQNMRFMMHTWTVMSHHLSGAVIVCSVTRSALNSSDSGTMRDPHMLSEVFGRLTDFFFCHHYRDGLRRALSEAGVHKAGGLCSGGLTADALCNRIAGWKRILNNYPSLPHSFPSHSLTPQRVGVTSPATWSSSWLHSPFPLLLFLMAPHSTDATSLHFLSHHFPFRTTFLFFIVG